MQQAEAMALDRTLHEACGTSADGADKCATLRTVRRFGGGLVGDRVSCPVVNPVGHGLDQASKAQLVVRHGCCSGSAAIVTLPACWLRDRSAALWPTIPVAATGPHGPRLVGWTAAITFGDVIAANTIFIRTAAEWFRALERPVALRQIPKLHDYLDLRASEQSLFASGGLVRN